MLTKTEKVEMEKPKSSSPPTSDFYSLKSVFENAF